LGENLPNFWYHKIEKKKPDRYFTRFPSFKIFAKKIEKSHDLAKLAYQ
jgi:hypothetical protein